MSNKTHRLERYLEPSQLDQSEPVGEGFAGRIWRRGRYAIKTAHPTPEARRRIAQEIELLQRLQRGQHPETGKPESWSIPTPRLYAHNAEATAFVRDFLPGASLYHELRCDPTPLSDARLDALYEVYRATERFREATGQRLDFAPSNLFYDEDQGTYVLCDLGLRLAPSRFVDVHRDGLWQALQEYVIWREALDASIQLRPMGFPPSGRFHIEVPMGPIKAGRVLWHNTWLSERLALPWDRMYLRRIAGVATHAPKKDRHLPASLYQDAASKGEGFARGDGRAVYLGEITTEAAGDRELMLKGCGPTPLAWIGNEFHEDGLVSFQRTLWETSVAHELARLGFDSPEMLAILGTGKTTIDNTLIEWPAAAAIRTAPTHFRVGHLVHYIDDPEALKALCRHIGRRLVRQDFAPQKVTHVEALLRQFSLNLGWDVGRTDALNIHGFNPTMGNIRIDGHLIDFSTVRFFRHYVPHFRYMNNTRMLREHKAAMRRHPRHLILQLRQGGLLSQAQSKRLLRRCSQWFDRRYIDGYIDGFCQFLGLDPAALSSQSEHRRKMLVQDTQHLRKLRADEELHFAFWEQSCPGPLFDLEGQMPAFVRAWRRGEPAPWKTLRSSFAGTLRPFDACMARSWFDNLQRMLSPAQLRRLTPRRWEQIISPFMEVERLAALCYKRSTPEDFDEWRCHISMARQLQPGTYTCKDAQQQARQRGHLCFPNLPAAASPDKRAHGPERCLVGMTLPLYHRICDAVEDRFEDRLLGIIAYGARASEGTATQPSRRLHLVEAGPDAPRTSRLHLLILLRKAPRATEWTDDTVAAIDTTDAMAAALRDEFNGFGAPFAIGRHPRHPLLWELEAADLDEALTTNASALPFGLKPTRTVIVYDPQKGCAPAHAR